MANPPPPYADITGISRAVMKDNAQESLINYDGNARPGELVVDLTQDPPPLYVGNNAGQLTLVASSTSLQLAVYANATTRDAAVPVPQTGMLVYLTDSGLQVRGTTSWNTVAGTNT